MFQRKRPCGRGGDTHVYSQVQAQVHAFVRACIVQAKEKEKARSAEEKEQALFQSMDEFESEFQSMIGGFVVFANPLILILILIKSRSPISCLLS